MASSRPRQAGETATRKGFARARRALLLLPVIALLAVALAGPGTAIAASGSESTSGYSGKPSEPGTGTSPSKESNTPAKEEEPSNSSTPSSESKSSTLPRTGCDLRWSFAIGLALMGAGFSIIVVQRRARRGDSR